MRLDGWFNVDERWFPHVHHVGSADHLDYTVVGKTVNLAARLCGIAHQSIVASKAVRDAAAGERDFSFSTERAVTIRGVREPITVYDLERPGD